ncbi:DUF3443 family protein [Ramlibacter sp. MMS24-I3-19]|uniref:DUF3443 family protein n=1 Tax=Ramlibacter sp. MMS24-I3-19 TaxID=3416606 RepID=UPI003D0011B5
MAPVPGSSAAICCGFAAVAGCTAFLVACGGGGGGGQAGAPAAAPAPAPSPAPLALGIPNASGSGSLPAAANNVLRVQFDRGVRGTAFNTPYVTITVCIPGSNICRDIDHVLVDTGSWGLRLLAGAIPTELALPAVRTGSGAAAGQCVQFASGYTWGAVRTADVRLSSQSIADLPVQVIADPDPAFVSAPAQCSSPGTDLGARLDANGVLGVGMLRYDCGPACTTSTTPGIYFACTAQGCTPATLPLRQQVVNPVAMLATHNNGAALVVQQVPAGGATTLEGALVLGIGTSDNNQLGAAQVLAMDSRYQLTTLYKGRRYPTTIDTGANALFIPDGELPVCGALFCPPQRTTLQAQLQSPSGAQRDVTLAVEALATLAPGAVAGNLGQSDAAAVTLGLPFFFGRTVFVALKDAATPAGPGPYWAF